MKTEILFILEIILLAGYGPAHSNAIHNLAGIFAGERNDELLNVNGIDQGRS